VNGCSRSDTARVPKPRLMRAAVVVAASVCAAPSGSAQTVAAAQAAATQELPIFGTGVQVVAVPVFVTDKSGHAVEGLTAADFEIKDQKHSVPIVAFQAVDASAPDLPAQNAGLLVQAAARRQILFLFDLTFSSPTGIIRARDAAMRIARTALAPGDLAAVATYSQAGIRMLIGFSPDHEQVARAIQTLGLREDRAPQDALSLSWELGVNPAGFETPSDVPSGRQAELNDFWSLLLMMQAQADNVLYAQRVGGFLGGLSRLGDMLEALQGRKHVILLSGGFDQWVLQGERGQDRAASDQAIITGQLWQVKGDHYFGDASSGHRLQEIYDALASSDTVIHTVEIGGMATHKGRMEQVESVEQEDLFAGRDSLADLASGTGGRFVHDANDLVAGLQEILDATRYYYVLAFEPSDDHATGKLRRLKVEVKREGLSVSHRAGYVLADPSKAKDPVSWQLQAAETIAKGLSGGPIALHAVGVPYRDEKGATRLPVVLEIDSRSLADSGAHPLKLQVFGYAFDAQSRVQDAFASSPVIDLARLGPPTGRRNVQVITSFAVAEGPTDLRFVVRDTRSGRTGSLRLELSVPSFAGQRLVLSLPLFVDDPRARAVVLASTRGNPALQIPFRLSQRAFTVNAWPTLTRGRGREVCVFAWSGAGAGAPTRYDVTAELVDAQGARSALIAGSARVVQDADGFERVVMAVDPGPSPSGESVLRVTLTDPATGATGSSETAVRVE
jgi:VWFA-related protein